MLNTSNRGSRLRSPPSFMRYDTRMSQLKNPSARNEFRGNRAPVAGSIARTLLRDPPNPANALNGFPVFACTMLESIKSLHTADVAPSVNRWRTSFGVGPQSDSQLRFVRSPGLFPKSLAILFAFVQA